MKYALDTNTISFTVNGNAVVRNKLNAVIDSDDMATIPLMAYYEARRGLIAANATRKLQSFDKLCARLERGTPCQILIS